MAGYNRIIVIGNLTRDPDYKQLASGQPVSQLGIASNRQYRNKQTGAMVQEVCFVDVDVFGPQAESCKQYLQKGRAVLIEGRLKFDSWESPEGQKRSKHSIVADRVVFLGGNSTDVETSNKSDAQQAKGDQAFYGAKTQQAKKSSKKAEADYESNDEQSAKSDSGEFEFQDEPPFQDDLPF
ncbi:MAG: single-stranded DNA-binding protein [Candidatus Babeliales bacterium]